MLTPRVKIERRGGIIMLIPREKIERRGRDNNAYS